MKPLMHLVRNSTALMFLAVLTLASCVPNQVEKSKGETLDQYETIVRWSQWDAAADFIAPEYMAEHPISRLEMDRLRLFRVTSYTLRSAASFDEGMKITQTVEIKMFNFGLSESTGWRHDSRDRPHAQNPQGPEGRPGEDLEEPVDGLEQQPQLPHDLDLDVDDVDGRPGLRHGRELLQRPRRPGPAAHPLLPGQPAPLEARVLRDARGL